MSHDYPTENPPANERASKRHRAAALQDAVAMACAPLIPQGFGVRQPYAAFPTSCARISPFIGLMLLGLGVWALLTSAATRAQHC